MKYVPHLLAASFVLVCLGRFAVPGHDLSWAGAYEAVAHIWVGLLLGLATAGKSRGLCLVLVGAATALETVCFLLRSH